MQGLSAKYMVLYKVFLANIKTAKIRAIKAMKGTLSDVFHFNSFFEDLDIKYFGAKAIIYKIIIAD